MDSHDNECTQPIQLCIFMKMATFYAHTHTHTFTHTHTLVFYLYVLTHIRASAQKRYIHSLQMYIL